MEKNKNDFKWKQSMGDAKPKREHLDGAVKAAKHTTRAKILEQLKKGEKSTADLESLIEEDRYNLYHHLDTLEDFGLIVSSRRDKKTKSYTLPLRPKLAIVELKRDVIDSKREKFNEWLEILSDLDEDIPYRDKIGKAEIYLNYNWADEDK